MKPSSFTSADWPWIDSRRYQVLSSICDTFLPSLPTTSTEIRQLAHDLQLVCPNLPPDQTVFPIQDIHQHSNLFQRNTQSNHISEIFALTIQRNTLRDEQAKLYLLLWCLSYSLTTFFLTGYWRSFDQLSLSQRQKALLSLKYSYFELLRSGFQVSSWLA